MRYTILFLAGFVPSVVFAQDNLLISINPQKARHPEITYEQLDPGKLKVVVTDSGVPVGGLELNDFHIRSELSEYEIKSVQPLLQTENAKVSLILCIDNSFSMQEHLGILKATLEELLASLGPSVKIASVFFQENFSGVNDQNVETVPNIRLYGLTRNKNEVRKHFLSHLQAGSLSNRTYLYDEIYAGLRLAEQVTDPQEGRYVIVLSDGLDNASRKNKDALRDLTAKDSTLVFFTIDFLTQENSFLIELAKKSGGRHFQAKKAEELGAIFTDISKDIVKLSGYLVSYRVPRAFLAGRVLKQGGCEPLAQARIVCFPVHQPALQQEAGANKNGVYHLKVALPHRWRVLASAPDYVSDSTEVEVTEESLYFADFVLAPAIVELTGKVTDAGITPLPEAQVTVTELETGEKLLEGVTDSLGYYHVTSKLNRSLLITATKSGYTFASLETDKVTAATVLPDIVLGLTAEGVVSEFRFLFEFNSDKLNVKDVATQTQLQGCLDFVKRELEKSPTRTVRLVGWTDNIGGAEYNINLSQRRARYISNYLVTRGIAAERIVAEGNGISTKYDNATEAGRAFNRRTDVIFFDRQ
ncbi:MAG: OmpA family protein [candidate division KSB1 bacterium]|nr:OmpA family protein [candidate division KSB1 bacterium]MDZ7304280.1 OmpA family protein [candidate division KSB1 bacterium]MDZ7312921.1 OmpA family protein [candidate division KSB1 bacterium]